MLEDAVHDRAQDVELDLVVGGVADPNGPASAIAGEIIELGLGRLLVPVHRVEDLQARTYSLVALHDAALWLEHVAEEGEEVRSLGVKAQCVQ